MSCLLPRAKLQRVTFFMKRSYLLPRENFKLPYLSNQAYWDAGIYTQLRCSHIHSIHKKSRDFINGNFVYLALICAVWSSRGRAGKKVTEVTFFRCPTVIKTIPYCIMLGGLKLTGEVKIKCYWTYINFRCISRNTCNIHDVMYMCAIAYLPH